MFLCLIITDLYYACDRKVTPAGPNGPPSTTLANIPVDGDTLFALVHLEWDGGDYDGYIVGYEYKYTTHYLFREDSLVQDWQFTKETSLTIAFNSADILNKQYFQIRAVDSDGNVDPNPAKKMFYTIQTKPPVVEIKNPTEADEMFVINHVTDWWGGIKLEYTGYDDDGDIIEYAWSADDNDWNWTADTSIFITPDHFDTPLTGQHTISLIARDNTNITSTAAFTIKLKLIEPTFSKDIYIIDETNENEFPSSARTTDAAVDSFYSELFDTEDGWDYEYNAIRGNPLPSKEILGQYKMLVWHADNRPGTGPHEFNKYKDYFRDYMNVGGDFFLSGWRVLRSFNFETVFPTTFQDTSFVHEYLHIVKADESPLYPGDFAGATGTFGLSHIEVDTEKLSGFPYNGYLSEVNIVLQAAGFTEVLYRYRGPQNSQLTYIGLPCGLRYIGTSFNAVILGFPLYFISENDVNNMVNEILGKLEYR